VGVCVCVCVCVCACEHVCRNASTGRSRNCGGAASQTDQRE
jgi:hypothetical protein